MGELFVNCKHCNKPLKDGVKFCSSCGCRVDSNETFSANVDKTITVDEMRRLEEERKRRQQFENQENQREAQNVGESRSVHRGPFPNQNVMERQRPQQMPVQQQQRPVQQQQRPVQQQQQNHNMHRNDTFVPRQVKTYTEQGKIRTVFSIALTVLLCFSLAVSMFLTLVHVAFSENSVESWIRKEKIYEKYVPNGDGEKGSEKVVDIVHESIDWYFGSLVTKNRTKALIKEDYTLDFIVTIALEYRDYIFNGNVNNEGLTPQRLADFIVKNQDDIVVTLSDAKSGGTFEKISKELTEYISDEEYILEEAKYYLGEDSSIASIDEMYGDDLAIVQFFLSSDFLAIMWGATVLLLLTVVLLSLSNYRNILSYVGSALLFTGVAVFVSKLVITSFAGSTNSLIYCALEGFLAKLSTCMLSFVIIGVVMVAVRIVLYVIQKSNSNKTF